MYSEFSKHDHNEQIIFDFSGRPRSVRSDENVTRVQDVINTTPTKSIRSVAHDTNLKRESVRQILRADLKYKLCKIPVVQELNHGDFEARVACNALLDLMQENLGIESRMLMTDKSIFSLDNSCSPTHKRH